jgi:hypothetical protein
MLFLAIQDAEKVCIYFCNAITASLIMVVLMHQHLRKIAAIHWRSGELTRPIMAFNGSKEFMDTELLSLPMPNTMAVGDTFNIIAGCNKLKRTCIDKFNNIVNFRGFPMYLNR